MNREAEENVDAPEPQEGRDRAGAAAGEDASLCDLCGRPMRERHCKLVCLNCGYQRDCSDP